MARWRAWWDSRHPRSDTLQLTQRNVYILPTRAGWLCALLLLVLLIGSINYQLNLGYLLTFVLASAAVASMHSGHATLRGLQLSLATPLPVHAGEVARLNLQLSDPSPRPRRRHGIGLRLDMDEATAPTAERRHGKLAKTARSSANWTWIDLPDASNPAADPTTFSSTVQLPLQPTQRGWHVLPTIRLETRFPFGLFRAWSVWRPAARLLAWPAPEQPAPPLPSGPQHGAAAQPTSAGSERDGVRAYRRGDALTQIAWKKSAQALTGGGELVSRDQPGAPQRTLQLRWADTAELANRSARPGQPPDPQAARLARLTAWLLAADRSGALWSLDLPGLHLPASRGEAQRSSALLALATWSLPDGLAPADGLAQPAATDSTDSDPPDPSTRWRPRPSGTPLPREARDTLFLLATLGWTLLPQFGRVPLWCSGFAVIALLWRGWLAWRSAALPPRWLLVLALAAAAALTWQQHHSLIGKEAGVSLLVLLAALKTLELRAQRDHWVVFGLGFFLILANFLYSQSLATALAMLAAVLGLLTTLTLAHMPAGRPRLWRAARLTSHQTLIGAPLVLLLFVFFPRVAPLWSVPGDTLARTGLSDRLRLGDVAELASDDSLALRVHFDAAVPPREALYFRGPVLVYNDGQQWLADPTQPASAGSSAATTAGVSANGPGLSYDMTIEPLRVHTLPLLELTLAPPQLEGATLTLRHGPDLQWTSTRPLAERLRVHAVAQLDVRWTQAGADQAQPALLMERLLPPGAHPRSLAWARALRATPEFANASAEQLAQALLAHIRSGGYAYTLSPGVVADGDALDRFWLDRKEGFCEHYATAFVVLMRAMGVPARIVTGYQGGQFNPLDNVLEVRQSDAHAWAEYWQTGRGWVRIDPTAAVAPERVQQGRRLRSPPGLVAGRLGELNPALAEQLRALWGTLDHRWNQWVISHNQSRQQQLLRDLGWPEVDELALGRALLLGLAGLGLLGAGWAAWDARRNRPRLDPWLRAWLGLQRQLRQRGLPIEPYQPPRSVADSARTRWGDAAEPLVQALDAFEQTRYGRPSRPPTPLSQQLRDVRRALRTLPHR